MHNKTNKNFLCAQWRLRSACASTVWSVFTVHIKNHWVLSYPLSMQHSSHPRWMPRLIWVSTGRKGHLVGFSCSSSYDLTWGSLHLSVLLALAGSMAQCRDTLCGTEPIAALQSLDAPPTGQLLPWQWQRLIHDWMTLAHHPFSTKIWIFMFFWGFLWTKINPSHAVRDFCLWDSTHHGCCSRLLSIPWGTLGTTRRRHANNDAHKIDDFIGCEGDFPI